MKQLGLELLVLFYTKRGICIEKNCGYCRIWGNGRYVVDTAPCGITTRFADISMWTFSLKKVHSIIIIYVFYNIYLN